jgi:glyoxylase-like metal-dependent hydrolase (beta-lactamase superfamily II)
MNLSILIPAVVLLLLAVVAPGFSQQPSVLTTEQIAENVYLIKGGIANTGFIVGKDAVFAIDAGMTAESARSIVGEIKKTTSKPLSGLILTHSDGDHVNGLGGFPEGLETYSSAGARKEMEEAFETPDLQALKKRLPQKTFTDKMEIDLGSEKVRLLYFGPAHTSGDAVVFLPAKRLVFVGDLVFIGRDPLIHRQKGGTALGLIRTLESVLQLDADRFVPGHNDVLSREDVEKALAHVKETVARVRALLRENRSPEETKKALGIPESPPSKGGFSFPSLAEVVYLELSESE